MSDPNPYQAALQLLTPILMGVGIVVTICMGILGWLHMRGMAEIREVKEALVRTVDSLSKQGERLAAGNVLFKTISEKLDEHCEKFDDHEVRIRGLEQKRA